MKQFKHYFHPEHFTKVSYQLIFFCVSFIIFLILLYKPFIEFHPIDTSIAVQPVTNTTIEQWHKTPVPVKVGMTITDFLKFDAIKSEFAISAIIWFVYDSSKISQDIINKFEFTKGEFSKKSEPTLSIIKDTFVQAQYTIKLQFSSLLDYARFPLDDHQIFLYLSNPAVTAQEMVYQTQTVDYVLSEQVNITGWKIVGHESKSGYIDVALGNKSTLSQPIAVFSIDISKQDLRQLALILLPLLFLFFMGLFAFSVPEAAISVSLPLASTAGLFAYSFVIQTLAPAVSYLMLSDFLFLFFLISSFITFLVSTLGALPKQWVQRSTLNKIEGITIVLLYIAFVAYWYYLTQIKHFV